MLLADAAQRATAQEVLNHPWIQGTAGPAADSRLLCCDVM
jgi:hypothetical protein